MVVISHLKKAKVVTCEALHAISLVYYRMREALWMPRADLVQHQRPVRPKNKWLYKGPNIPTQERTARMFKQGNYAICYVAVNCSSSIRQAVRQETGKVCGDSHVTHLPRIISLQLSCIKICDPKFLLTGRVAKY